MGFIVLTIYFISNSTDNQDNLKITCQHLRCPFVKYYWLLGTKPSVDMYNKHLYLCSSSVSDILRKPSFISCFQHNGSISRNPFYWHDLSLIPAWIIKSIIMWDEITYPFPSFNGCAVDILVYRVCDYLSMLRWSRSDCEGRPWI